VAAEQIDIIDLACERDERELFARLDCCLQAGDVLQVAGPNGAGKTSLLRILAGLMPASAGDIHYGGRSILGGSGREFWRRHLLFLGHATAVKATLSAEENLSWLCALDQPVDREAIWDALAAVGLRGYEDVPCRQMSAGQQRRVALARLRLQTAKPIWVLDEPFTALDRAAVQVLEQQILAFARDGGIAVLTTHHSLDHLNEVRRLDLGRVC
jgi:heme exporter protein A|tara:strand:- start:9464 stop:10102 length:639 start_codon:yes stop_codon:yes gene_type:complete